MEQIGSEYNFKTGGAIKELNDVIARVEALEKAQTKLGKTTKETNESVNNTGKSVKKSKVEFDALGNSINQVTRELPSFAFSAQTGFLAISNNIPILLDSIEALKNKNAELAKEGKATIPVFKQIISSLFSWQTAVSLLISFTVMYGKEITSFVKNLFTGKKAIDEATLSIENYNKAFKNTNYKQAIDDINQLKTNIYLYRQELLSEKEVVDEFNKSLGKTSKEIKTVAEAEEFLIKSGAAFIRMTFLKTTAITAQSEASKLYVEEQILLAKREEELSKNRVAIERETQNILANAERFAFKGRKKTQEELAKEEIKIRSIVQQRYTKEFDQQIIDLDNQNKILLNISEKAFKEAATIANKYDLSLFGDNNESKKKLLTEFELLQEEQKKLTLKIQNGLLSGADISKDSLRLEVVNNKLKEIQDTLDTINGVTYKEAIKEIEDFAREVNAQANKDLIKRREAEKKAIKDGILGIEVEYSKIKEGKELSVKEELELERGKQLAIISLLNQYKEQNNEVQNDILERTIKLNELNYKINKQSNIDEVKATKDSLEEELQANRKFYIDRRNLKEYSTKELAQLDVIELESQLDILNDYKAQGLDVNKEILDAEEALQKARLKLKKDANKEGLKDDKETARQQREIFQAATELGSTLSSGYFDLRKSELENETNIQIKELEKQKEAKVISEEEYNTKRSEILNDQARKQREYNLAEIRVQTALAIIRAYATGATIFDRVLAAGLAAATGLAQYAFASAQPLPQFAKGTDRVIGGTKGKDSVHALLMPDEAVIPTKENLARPGLAKAWINGNLDSHLMMNYIKPAIEENNKKWEAVLKVNQNSTFIRNDSFNDKNIVKQLVKSNRINQRLINNLVDGKSIKRNRRLWN